MSADELNMMTSLSKRAFLDFIDAYNKKSNLFHFDIVPCIFFFFWSYFIPCLTNCYTFVFDNDFII